MLFRDVLCSAVGVVLHFFGLSTFFWTLLEGHQLLTAIKVGNHRRRIKTEEKAKVVAAV